MNSSAHFIRVPGRALPTRKTTVLRLLDVQVRAVTPDLGARKTIGEWAGSAGEAEAKELAAQVANVPGRQQYFL